MATNIMGEAVMTHRDTWEPAASSTDRDRVTPVAPAVISRGDGLRIVAPPPRARFRQGV